MATIPVKWFSSTMQGAPAWGVNTTVGTMLPVLRGCLSQGFNSRTVTSLAVANEVATATFTNGHGYLKNQVIEISGASPSGLNGQWRVKDVPTVQTLTFDCVGISDQTATGTITSITPSLDWEEPFGAPSGNNMVWRSKDTSGPRGYLRVNDAQTSANYAMVYGYESMTDMTTGANAFYENNGHWTKCNANTAWTIIGDRKTFYVFYLDSNNYWQHNVFGEFSSFVPNDAGRELLNLGGMSGSGSDMEGWLNTAPAYRTNGSGNIFRRNGIGTVNTRFTASRNINDSPGYSGPAFPSPVDNGLLLSDVILRDWDTASGHPIRGKLRGAYWVMQNQPFVATVMGSVITGVSGLEGRIIRILPHSQQNPNTGRVAIDQTGPWE
jgi:hypothetical protein